MRIDVPNPGRGLLVRSAIGSAALLVLLAALASAASAAAIAPTAACFANARGVAPVGIIGSGFTPGDDIAVNGNGFFASGTALANGTIAITGPAPVLPTSGAAVRTYTLNAQDESVGPTVLATTTINVTNLAISLSPDRVKDVHRDRVTYRFSGFRPGLRIYANFRRKQTLARFKFGKAAGPCGTAKAKALLFPGGHPGHDKYTVTFEQTKHYSQKAIPRIVTSLDLFHF